MISTKVMDVKLRETAEGLGEDSTGKKKSKFKTFKKLFGKKKRKEAPSSTGESTWKQTHVPSDVITLETGPVGYDSEDELEDSRGALGSRALSHDSIFFPEAGQDPARPVRVFSQENVCDRIKALQLKIQCHVKMGPPPPGGLPAKRVEDTGMSSEDDGLPRSPPEMSLLHEVGPSTTIKVSLAPSPRLSPRLLPPDHLFCRQMSEASVLPRTSRSSLAPVADFDYPPEFSSCLDNSAAKHKLLVKPRNQRSSKMRRLSSRAQSESLSYLLDHDEEDYEEKPMLRVCPQDKTNSGQQDAVDKRPEPRVVGATLQPEGPRARRARLQHSPALRISGDEENSPGDQLPSCPVTPEPSPDPISLQEASSHPPTVPKTQADPLFLGSAGDTVGIQPHHCTPQGTRPAPMTNTPSTAEPEGLESLVSPEGELRLEVPLLLVARKATPEAPKPSPRISRSCLKHKASVPSPQVSPIAPTSKELPQEPTLGPPDSELTPPRAPKTEQADILGSPKTTQVEMSQGTPKTAQVETSQRIPKIEQVDMSQQIPKTEQMELPQGTPKTEQVDVSQESPQTEQVNVSQESPKTEQVGMSQGTPKCEHVEKSLETPNTSHVETLQGAPKTTEMEIPQGTPKTEQVAMSEGTPKTEQMEMSKGTPKTEHIEMSKGSPKAAQVDIPQGTTPKTDIDIPQGTPKTEQVMSEGSPKIEHMEMSEGTPKTEHMDMSQGIPKTAQVEMSEGAPLTAQVEMPQETPKTADVDIPQGTPKTEQAETLLDTPKIAQVEMPQGSPKTEQVEMLQGTPKTEQAETSLHIPKTAQVEMPQGSPKTEPVEMLQGTPKTEQVETPLATPETAQMEMTEGTPKIEQLEVLLSTPKTGQVETPQGTPKAEQVETHQGHPTAEREPSRPPRQGLESRWDESRAPRFSVSPRRATPAQLAGPGPGSRLPLARSGSAWRSEAASEPPHGPPADSSPRDAADRAPFPVKLRSTSLSLRHRDAAAPGLRGPKRHSAEVRPEPPARDPQNKAGEDARDQGAGSSTPRSGKGRAPEPPAAKPPLPRKPLLQALTLPPQPAPPAPAPGEPPRGARRDKKPHPQRGAEKSHLSAALGPGVDNQPAPPWITVSLHKRRGTSELPPEQEDRPGAGTLRAEMGKHFKVSTKQADFVRSKSFLITPAKPTMGDRDRGQGKRLHLQEGLQRGISLSHQNLAQAAMMTEKELHQLKRASYTSTDQPSWMELARKKSQAWSDMPQIIK